MKKLRAKLAGVELYFEHLDRAKRFYRDVLGLEIRDEQRGHHAQFDTGSAFLCLEAKRSEPYPSRDKAVIFLEVKDLAAAIGAIGPKRFLHIERTGQRRRPSWAVMPDPEGHNLLFLGGQPRTRRNTGRNR